MKKAIRAPDTFRDENIIRPSCEMFLYFYLFISLFICLIIYLFIYLLLFIDQVI